MSTAIVTDLPPFRNEPVLELRRATERQKLLDGLAWLDARPPVDAATLIGGDRRSGDDIVSTDPANPERVVARAPRATPAEVAAAVESVQRGFPAWSRVPARERAAILVRAAAEMREARTKLAALAMREAGKPWAEADADICEAIDFLEFYARGAIALERGH